MNYKIITQGFNADDEALVGNTWVRLGHLDNFQNCQCILDGVIYFGCPVRRAVEKWVEVERKYVFDLRIGDHYELDGHKERYSLPYHITDYFQGRFDGYRAAGGKVYRMVEPAKEPMVWTGKGAAGPTGFVLGCVSPFPEGTFVAITATEIVGEVGGND